MFQLTESKSVLFEESQTLTAEQLLLATEFTEFRFKVFLSASQMFKLKAIATLQIVLFGQQSLTFLFDLFFKPLLFFFNLLPKQFSLNLQIVRLLRNFLKLVLMGQLPFGLLTIQQHDFSGQVFTSSFG